MVDHEEEGEPTQQHGRESENQSPGNKSDEDQQLLNQMLGLSNTKPEERPPVESTPMELFQQRAGIDFERIREMDFMAS